MAWFANQTNPRSFLDLAIGSSYDSRGFVVGTTVGPSPPSCKDAMKHRALVLTGNWRARRFKQPSKLPIEADSSFRHPCFSRALPTPAGDVPNQSRGRDHPSPSQVPKSPAVDSYRSEQAVTTPAGKLAERPAASQAPSSGHVEAHPSRAEVVRVGQSSHAPGATPFHTAGAGS
jgi:hypothetical protein